MESYAWTRRVCTVWVRDSSLKKFSFPTKAPGGAPTGALAHPSSSMVSACGFVNLYNYIDLYVMLVLCLCS